jgi:hypothetical protein
VKRALAICCVAFALSGCMTAEQQQAKRLHDMDASDDAYCRQKADGTVSYEQCRKNVLQLRQAAMASPGAGANDMGGAMKEAGARLQALSPPPPGPPTVCQSTPWVGGVRTTCQ